MTPTGCNAAAPPPVQPLHGDDVPAVAELMERAFDPVFGEAWNHAQCLAIFALPGYRMSGAWAGDNGHRLLWGFTIDRSIGNESELLLIAVDPIRHRRGIGRALVTNWLARCADTRVERAFLEVRADNPARFFYESLGFVQTGLRPNYYRGNDGTMRDAITMSRQLR